MKYNYGCIGERLKHSFSKQIHNALADYDYELIEIARDKLADFARAADFRAINVTIPYKESILPYLAFIDEHAKQIGAVNTVVNRGGALYGYNTDFYGMRELIGHAGITLSGRSVVILGTGGTSKTARAVAKYEGAASILRVSRSKVEDAISYDELYDSYSTSQIIINTTPVGMYPNIEESPIDLTRFSHLEGVIDVVYNPLRTPLILAARKLGIPSEGGLYMLVAQAVRASEIFLDKKYGDDALDSVFTKIYSANESIVLTGMPSSGKSTVGRLLALSLNREFVDTDELIVKKDGRQINRIFEESGELYFRNLETEVIKELSSRGSLVIATGGGAVLREENVTSLKKNGRIFFLDRPLWALMPTSDRPLASTREAIEKRYRERIEIYRATADVIIPSDATPEQIVAKIKDESSL